MITIPKKKLQLMLKSKLLIYIILLFFSSEYISAKNIILIKADSLFKENDLKNSKVLYDSLFYNYELYNNNLLIKLAFLEEELGNYEKTIFYLKFLKKNEENKIIENKINKIIAKNRLESYQKSDYDIFQIFLYKYKFNFIYLLFIIIIIVFSINGFLYIKKKRFILTKTFLITNIVLLLTLNIKDRKEGIIQYDNVFIMHDPSSGSNIYSTINRGEKVRITNEKEIWYEIEINDERKFVRKKNILILN